MQMNQSAEEKYILDADINRLKEMDYPALREFCEKTREFLIDRVTVSGGHLASNLGVVEISVAIARKFDMPLDKVIYDTGHQSYVHKIVTGRAKDFTALRKFGGISGFPKMEESEFDAFGTGHSGTGLAAALGYAKANKLDGNKNWAVAVVGDGSLPGGEVFEALNNISRDDRIIIILNDNKMSISKSVGALKRTLYRLRTANYYKTKDSLSAFLMKIPVIGRPFAIFLKKIKTALKRTVMPYHNFFEQFGLRYYGPADGNDIEKVEFLIEEAKRKEYPAIIHLCTKKGKGYAPAEQNPTSFHGISPKSSHKSDRIGFSESFGEKISRLAENDKNIVAITCAMTDGVGLSEFAKKYPERLFDTGIAEECAMTFAAALSAAGKKPVFAVYSSFFQRSFDQLIHDTSLQKLPCLICLDRAGIVGEDGATHHGLYDIAMANLAPFTEIYAPATTEESEMCIEKALDEWKCPTVIRYPKGTTSSVIESEFENRILPEKKIYGTNPEILIVTFGRTIENAVISAKKLSERGIGTTLVKFCKLKGFSDSEFFGVFEGISAKKIIFIEEGMKKGSFSETVLTKFSENGMYRDASKKIIAPDEEFIMHGTKSELFDIMGFSPEKIIEEIEKLGNN